MNSISKKFSRKSSFIFESQKQNANASKSGMGNPTTTTLTTIPTVSFTCRVF